MIQLLLEVMRMMITKPFGHDRTKKTADAPGKCRSGDH